MRSPDQGFSDAPESRNTRSFRGPTYNPIQRVALGLAAVTSIFTLTGCGVFGDMVGTTVAAGPMNNNPARVPQGDPNAPDRSVTISMDDVLEQKDQIASIDPVQRALPLMESGDGDGYDTFVFPSSRLATHTTGEALSMDDVIALKDCRENQVGVEFSSIPTETRNFRYVLAHFLQKCLAGKLDTWRFEVIRDPSNPAPERWWIQKLQRPSSTKVAPNSTPMPIAPTATPESQTNASKPKAKL